MVRTAAKYAQNCFAFVDVGNGPSLRNFTHMGFTEAGRAWSLQVFGVTLWTHIPGKFRQMISR